MSGFTLKAIRIIIGHAIDSPVGAVVLDTGFGRRLATYDFLERFCGARCARIARACTQDLSGAASG